MGQGKRSRREMVKKEADLSCFASASPLPVRKRCYCPCPFNRLSTLCGTMLACDNIAVEDCMRIWFLGVVRGLRREVNVP